MVQCVAAEQSSSIPTNCDQVAEKEGPRGRNGRALSPAGVKADMEKIGRFISDDEAVRIATMRQRDEAALNMERPFLIVVGGLMMFCFAAAAYIKISSM